MVESLQMFLFLFKSKYRRKYSWFSPFLCSILIVLLFCDCVTSKCSDQSCLNGVCKNETCVCYEGWQGAECQFCDGKIKLTAPEGIITDGPSNYSVSTQCSWLISPPRVGPSPPPIRIRLESFSTECGWDHLYVYDGDSVRAEKLLGVFSGVLEEEESAWTRQVIARSGHAFLHFFSDDAYAMEGFNVSYAAYSCPSNEHETNCSNQGECDDGTCRCEPGWIGVACDQPLCPEECNAAYGGGVCTSSGCACGPSRAGPACSRDRASLGWDWAWREPGEGPAGPAPAAPASAGHVLINYNDDLIKVGGESFSDEDFLYRYKVSEKRWSVVESRGPPASRFLHSAVLHGHELIVYGGIVYAHHEPVRGGLAGLEGRANEVTNELWKIRLDVSRPQWVNATPTVCSPHRAGPLKHCGGLHVSGHTAVLVYIGPTRKPVMLSFFGHSPHYGYLHVVQEYYIEEGVWTAAATRGWPARAGFGHTALWDDLSARVYVHAGLVSESESTQAPSASLYEYDVETKEWKSLPSAPTPRYLHSAVFISPGIMLIYGGNAHNDSVLSTASARCYSEQPLLYDVRCKAWYNIAKPAGAARAANAAALLPMRSRNTAILYGGFDGRVRSDALTLETGSACSLHTDVARCVGNSQYAALACAWHIHRRVCLPLEEVGWTESFDGTVKTCLTEPEIDGSACASAATCLACTGAGAGQGAGAGACAWCAGCVVRNTHACSRRRGTALSPGECAHVAPHACARYHSCAACHATHHHGSEDSNTRLCYWDYDSVKCRPANSTEDIRSVASGGGCSAPCSTFTTCSNCTHEECIWCSSQARCVDKNAYGASFPLGGCRSWSTSGGSGQCGARPGCQALSSCELCRREPACGWCDDGQGTGQGICLHDHRACTTNKWHFTGCPPCQCNGHSVCDTQHRCMQPCSGRAVGDHCDTCAPHHWGDPLNGQPCQPCDCNAQAVSCEPSSGRCYCSTKGLAGDRCDKCDNTNHYHADLYNKGACYYDLAVDYQFTFNLSKKEDRHLSAINFRNAPVKTDVDADFSITCSAHARMNLTVRTRTDPAERTLFSEVNCTNFKYKFAKSEHTFGVEDNVTLTTFFVYVYDFRPPLWIQISFSQYPKLNLQQFFITFSSCFLLLLLLAAALWKIKQKYDLYRRRQRLFVEMEQMASRPFSQVCVELERCGGGGGVPAPIALEPCRFGQAAVLSLLVRVPTGGTNLAPPHGGLCLASALVTLGPTRHKHCTRKMMLQR